MFERGDIVEIYFDLPRAKETKLHPAIIISNDDVHNKEEIYICVMMTSTTEIDLFSFVIEKEMLESPLKKDFSQARCHLVTYATEKHFEKRAINKMKSVFVDKLVDKIYNVSLTE